MGNRITICHWTDGTDWQALEISTSGLNGHDGHGVDIWPPVPDVTPGHNWPQGQAVYLNGCAITAEVVPTPSPSSSLPETGFTDIVLFLGMFFLVLGVVLHHMYRKDRDDRTGPR